MCGSGFGWREKNAVFSPQVGGVKKPTSWREKNKVCGVKKKGVWREKKGVWEWFWVA